MKNSFMNDIQDFYPTPEALISKIVSGIKFKEIESILEPSAGKGNIVDVVVEKLKFAYSVFNRKASDWDIDCIEINENLRHILKGKGYRVVHDDFLSYNTLKSYQLIIMNPPFSSGDKHLLKALEMQQEGGQVVCLLNAETLRNPFSNTRQDLVRKLKEYNADVTFLADVFLGSERSTGVEIAMVKVNIEHAKTNSIILDNLKKEEFLFTEKKDYTSDLIDADYAAGLVELYNFEVKAGLKLIAEYEALKPFLYSNVTKNYNSSPMLELELGCKDYDENCSMENSFIKQVRMKYWKELFESEQFMGLFTQNLKRDYYNKVNELRNYEFSLYNIHTIKIQLFKSMVTSLDDTILGLFDEFSWKYHWSNEFAKNIHYYNGWASNEAWKINDKRVIIPLNGYTWGKFNPNYLTKEKLKDIEKVFNYLQFNEGFEYVNMDEALDRAVANGQTTKIETTYFYLTFYKKGTCHIHFKYPELVKKLNIFGSQKKGWLPPSYSKKMYRQMTQEEKDVIDSFEGEKSYADVYSNPNKYILATEQLLLLA